ncbi:MAG TPA: hypothetical protein V6D47_19125 [Oscillatoriaceae cyanobacterium]
MPILMVPVLVAAQVATATAIPSPAPSPALQAKTASATVVPTFFGVPKGNRWVAGTFSLMVNGLGQYYNGENDTGNVMAATLLTFPIAYGVDSLTGSPYLRIFSYTAMTMVKVWSVWDAFTYSPPPPPKPAASPKSVATPAPSPSH